MKKMELIKVHALANGKHYSQVIYLDTQPREVYVTRQPLRQIKDFLKDLIVNAKNCKTCGGLIPELILCFNDKEFCFTCYEISDKKGVVAQTDYEKFGEWCKCRVESERGKK